MGDARRTLELFNRISVVLDVLLVILFLITGLFGLTLLIPTSIVINLCLQSVATMVLLLFGVVCLNGAERITGAMRESIEQAVEDQKTDEERAAPVVVMKKSVSATPPPVSAPTLTNTVLKTTKVVLKSSKSSPQSAATVAKRGRPKKDN